jgi:hypothetical protein
MEGLDKMVRPWWLVPEIFVAVMILLAVGLLGRLFAILYVERLVERLIFGWPLSP